MLYCKRCSSKLINHPRSVSHKLLFSLPGVSESDSGAGQVQPEDVEQIKGIMFFIRRNKIDEVESLAFRSMK